MARRCNDNNVCTQTDSCQTGSCTGANQLSCDDGNACTADSCNTTAGCTHTSVACLRQFEAESFSVGQGVTRNTSSVTPTAADSWIEFPNVDFGAPGDVGRFSVMLLGSPGDRHVQLRLNGATGPLVADLFSLSSDPQSAAPQASEFLTPVSGVHTVAIVFGSADAGTLDWFALEKGVGRDSVIDFPSSYQHSNPGQELVLTDLPNIVGDSDEDAQAVSWLAPPAAVTLAPGQTRGWEFTIPETVSVVAQARWKDSGGNVSASIYNAQAQIVATSGPGPFVAFAATSPLPPQQVGVMFTNNGSSSLTVQLMGGAMRVSP